MKISGHIFYNAYLSQLLDAYIAVNVIVIIRMFVFLRQSIFFFFFVIITSINNNLLLYVGRSFLKPDVKNL